MKIDQILPAFWTVLYILSGIMVTSCEGNEVVQYEITDNEGGNTGNSENNEVAITAITLSQHEISIEKGKSAYLDVYYSPINATEKPKPITWTSSDDSVASVVYGTVQGKGVGTAEIYAYCGGLSDKCVVSVYEPSPSLQLDITTLHLIPSSIVSISVSTKDPVTWSTSNKDVAIVDHGVVTAIAAGTATITAQSGDLKGFCEVLVENPDIPYVDLGLSVKWAAWNLGAFSPEEHGDYYAWGETKPKMLYEEENYKWWPGSYGENPTKYFGGDEQIPGHSLDPEDDVAHVILGGRWRLPTKEEFEELCTRCSIKYTSYEHVNSMGYSSVESGFEFTSPNGNSIFLPRSGWVRNAEGIRSPQFSDVRLLDKNCGYYWSSYLEINSVSRAGALLFSLDTTPISFPYLAGTSGFRGCLVRPVYDDSDLKPAPQEPEIVDLGLSVKWASCNLGAIKPEDRGDFYSWGETEPHYNSLFPIIWKYGMESGYSSECYKWCEWDGMHFTGFTKYNSNSFYGYMGFMDGKKKLDLEDDAVHVSLGSKWRMPTREEISELIEKCTWEFEWRGWVFGYKVTGPSGKSIFIPSAGKYKGTDFYETGVYYASSSLADDLCLFTLGYWNGSPKPQLMQNEYRWDGFTLRPVYAE